MNYSRYRLTWMENVKILCLAAGLTLLVAYLFYQSYWACVLFPIIYIMIRRRTVQAGIRKVRQELSAQFLDAMRVVNTALLAGYSLENAWKEAQKEIESLYGTSSYMYLELQEINQSVELNNPLEPLVEDFANRSGIEDILSFSEVFSFAKWSGGNFVRIIEHTTEHMRQKQETAQEIEVLFASRRMEQKVMDVIPIFILAYMKISSRDYMSVLYGNAAGVIFMSACLAVYVVAFLLAEKMMAIEV